MQPRTSPVACTTVNTFSTGLFQVRNAATGAELGYISNAYDAQRTYTYGSIANALRVTPDVPVQEGVPTQITAINGPDPAHAFLGGVGGSGGYKFASGQVGYAYLSGTGHTTANSPPSSTAGNSIQVLGYNGLSESTIWMFDCTSLAIAAQWTNVDGSQNPTSLMFDPVGNYLALTGDVGALNSAFGEGAYQTFTYAPNP